MAVDRKYHTATLLSSGMVLVVGGYSLTDRATGFLASAELYDPATGTFSATGTLVRARRYHTATLLPSGKVLIVGGEESATLASAELYDPTSGIFTATGSMSTVRCVHTAALLPNGKVLIAGGLGASLTDSYASAELYDPTTGEFTATGTMTARRTFHTMTLLSNGTVLMAGGEAENTNPFSMLASAEVYDPAAGTFAATGNLVVARSQQAATLLPNGKVIVASGRSWGNDDQLIWSAELYDLATGTFITAAASMVAPRAAHTETLLESGEVLMAGGWAARDLTVPNAVLASAELYDPTTGTFTATGRMGAARLAHTATLLPGGKVLLTGGMDVNLNTLASAELFE